MGAMGARPPQTPHPAPEPGAGWWLSERGRGRGASAEGSVDVEKGRPCPWPWWVFRRVDSAVVLGRGFGKARAGFWAQA